MTETKKTKTEKKLVVSKKMYYFPALNASAEGENATEALEKIKKQKEEKTK